MLNGSFFPLSVTPGTSTFRFVKYFSSILYGWRAPVPSNSVITNTGSASFVAAEVVFSGNWLIDSNGAGELVSGAAPVGIISLFGGLGAGVLEDFAASAGTLEVGSGLEFSSVVED